MKSKRIVCMLIAFVMAFGVAAVVNTIDIYAASSHTHTYGAWKVTKKATCKKAGQKQRKCKKCSKVQKKTIAKTAHQYGAWKTTKKATCKAAGQKQRTCKTCKAKQTATIAKTAHSYGAWKVTKKATCTANGEQQRTCKTCNAAQKQAIAKTGHSYGAWKTVKNATCTANGEQQRTCSRCSSVEKKTINKTGHDYGEWTTVKDPTCVDNGVQQRTCGKCGNVEKKTIAATGKHDWEDEPTIDWSPTCTAYGRESIHCENDNCAAVTDIEYISPTGHDYVGRKASRSISLFSMAPSPVAGKTVVVDKNAKGHTLASVCVKCNYHSPLPLEEHSFGEPVVREPNHSKEVKGSYPGSRKYTCEICGYSYSETIPAPPHDTVVTKTVAATCTARGQKYSECSVCGQEFFTYTDMPLGHKWSETPTVDRAATCTKDGQQSIHCENEGCTEVKNVESIPSLGGHKWGEWQTTTEPSCTKKGVATRRCDVCGEEETKAIASLGGHKFAGGELVVIKKATCTENGTMGRRCTNEGCTAVADATTIAKTGHKWVENVTVQATCTKAGSMTRTCSVCGTIEKEVEIPAGGGGHDWSGKGTVVRGGDNSCIPTVEYKECKDCGEKEYVTVDAGSGHNWVEAVNDRGQKHLKCSKCGEYQPGWGKLPKAGSDIVIDENGEATVNPEDLVDVNSSYRCVWIAYFDTDMSMSEGFNNHNGLKCASIGETRIVGGSSGYEDNQYTTISMKAPAARDGYKFVGWENACTKELITEDNPAQDGRYKVSGDTLILNWRAHEMTFKPIYEKVEKAAQPSEISLPESTQVPDITVPATEETAPVTEVTEPSENPAESEEPAMKPENDGEDALVTDDAA